MRRWEDVCVAFTKRLWVEIMRVIRCPLMFSAMEIVERSLHTCVFSCPIKPGSVPYPLCDWLGGERRCGGGRREEMRGEEIVLAVIRRYLAVTALVSLNSWGLSQLLMSRCVELHVNNQPHTRWLTLMHTQSCTCAHTHLPSNAHSLLCSVPVTTDTRCKHPGCHEFYNLITFWIMKTFIY